MHRIFAGLAIIASILLITEAVFGFTLHANFSLIRYHILLGVFIAIFVCLAHTMVMFHFIGSGKEIKEVVEFLGGEPQVIKDIRQFKMRVFPGATFAMLFTIAAEVIGGGVHTGRVSPYTHLAIAAIAIALNLFSFQVEYKVLKKNLELIDILVKKYNELTKKVDRE